MVLRNSYFYKELRQSNIESRISIRNSIFFSVFTALLAYLLHISFANLIDTVFADVFPYLSDGDSFSAVYIYVRVFILLSVLYFMIFYENISFSEIKSNRWYLLSKMGYSTKMMVMVKSFAQFLPLLLSFVIGFAGSYGMSILAGYSYSLDYLPALFIYGVAVIALLCSLITAFSLLNKFKPVFYSRCCILLVLSVLALLSEHTGFRSVLSSKNFISENGPLSPFHVSVSIYFTLILIAIAGLTVLNLFKAKTIAMYYDEPLANTDFSLPAGRVLARLDRRSGNFYIFRNSRFNLRGVVFHTLVVAFLCCVTVFAFLLNLYHYYGKAGDTVQIGDNIYVLSDKTVKSELQPLVSKNDFLVFKAPDNKENISEGVMILTQDDRMLIYNEQIQDTEIKGELHAVCRWLGAAVLLVNSTEGRVLFLALPVLIILLYNNIRKLIARKPVSIE